MYSSGAHGRALPTRGVVPRSVPLSLVERRHTDERSDLFLVEFAQLL